MKILSADKMANIPRAAIRDLVRKYLKANITEGGADELAKMLEEEAKRISEFAVGNAKKENRDRVTKKDITKYFIDRA